MLIVLCILLIIGIIIGLLWGLVGVLRDLNEQGPHAAPNLEGDGLARTPRSAQAAADSVHADDRENERRFNSNQHF